MKFGEKLQKLRKEKGMSQEELSFQLNVSRQAVSKWENDQGYPETEKMLMIGNIFSVSMDYLLKDQGEERNVDEKGYYASREIVQGYLAKEQQIAKKISLAVFMLICSGLPILLFPQWEDELSVISMIIIACAISIFIWLGFEEDQYKQIRKEPLIFDYDYLIEIKKSYQKKEKKLRILFVLAIASFFLMCIIAMVLEDILHLGSGPHEAIYLFIIAIGVYLIIYVTSIMDSYEPIIDNEEYQKEHNGYGWIYYVTCGTTAIIYVGLGLYYGKEAWGIGWVLIVIAAILTAGLIRVLNKKANL